jgi:DUF4097 and DUF4098 domain-containing protein YvlB
MNNATRIFANGTLCTAILFLISIFPVSCSTIQGSDEPYLTKTFSLTSGELFVSTSGGSIRVEGGNTNQVKVEMYVKSNKRNDNLKEILEDEYEIRIEKTGSRIEAVAKRVGKSFSWNGISISFVVYTPKDFACELNTSGGSLKLSGVVAKTHELKTSGGSITAENMTGHLNARTSGGSITINQYKGNIDAKTSGGSIKLEDINGDIEASTSGGGIKISSVEGSVYATTSGGSINAEIKKLQDQLILKTSGGSVNATIPSGLGLDLDLRGNRVNTSLNNFSGESKSDRVRGTVNGGGIPVQLATSGGSVNLNYY